MNTTGHTHTLMPLVALATALQAGSACLRLVNGELYLPGVIVFNAQLLNQFDIDKARGGLTH